MANDIVNENLNNELKKLGIAVPDVLLPAHDIDMHKWSVVACDQYTSQPEYWDEVENIVGNDPSTLRLILPEVYLESSDVEERINKINVYMKKYLDDGILISQKPGFIFLDRETSHVKSRKGLILAVDLEKYDYNKGSQTLIRATENTVIDRLPPRVRIRKNAPVEVPHIQILIDDPDMMVIEPIAKAVSGLGNNINGNKNIDMNSNINYNGIGNGTDNHISNGIDNDIGIEKIYDFDLVMGGGHVRGYRITGHKMIQNIASALKKLAEPEYFHKKYDIDAEKGVLLFAVGDGNHSLASAKVHWENVKASLSPEKLANHPARYAMVEIINVHDEGLIFEPIHRVLFNVDSKKLINAMKEYLGNYSPVSFKTFSSKEELDKEIDVIRKKSASYHLLPFISGDNYYLAIIEKHLHNLDVATLQEFLDYYIENNPKTKIDYIHGDDVVTSIGAKAGNLGFYLPPIDKHQLFKTVIIDGTLPRKTFSMGEAEEKRYYLECRRITL
jgi:hypothetical protein